MMRILLLALLLSVAIPYTKALILIYQLEQAENQLKNEEEDNKNE